MAGTVRMIGGHYDTGRERLTEWPGTGFLIHDALRTGVNACRYPDDQRRLRGVVNLVPARVVAPVSLGHGDQLGVALVPEDRRDGIRTAARRQGVGELVHVRAGDLVKPLDFKVLELVIVDVDKEAQRRDGSSDPARERLCPEVHQDAGQSSPYLGL